MATVSEVAAMRRLRFRQLRDDTRKPLHKATKFRANLFVSHIVSAHSAVAISTLATVELCLASFATSGRITVQEEVLRQHPRIESRVHRHSEEP